MKEKQKRVNLPFLEQFRHLKKYLILAGIKSETKIIFTFLFAIAGIIDIALLLLIIIKFELYDAIAITILSSIMFTLGYFAVFMLSWLGFLFMLDYLKFKRKTQLEEVLPEFLRLVSANHRAGLPLDMSIWKANRPRFGILSQEINEVAKTTYATGDLVQPLVKFAEKYDSSLLKRVVSNMVEGLRTGADLSSLLDDISTNITIIRNTRKELASEVENYMLFITVTVLLISPLMFALANKMASLIETVRGTLTESFSGAESTGVSNFPIDPTAGGEGEGFSKYFDAFVWGMILTNSVVSVLLMSIVKYGNVKQEIKKIPVYYAVGMIVYYICRIMFAGLLDI